MTVVLLVVVSVLMINAQCPSIPRRDSPPQGVYDLSPGDIDVVMGIGDSIITGYGIDNLLLESRSCAFSIGDGQGCDDLLTFPRLLQIFNPQVVGASKGTHFVQLQGFGHNEEIDNMNAAQTGSRAQDFESQVVYLAKRFQALKIDPKNVWKHVTVLIGSNNLCHICENDTSGNSPDAFEKAIRQGLTSLYQTLPKTFVSLVSFPKFTPLEHVQTDECKLGHALIYAECECVFHDPSDEKRKIMDDAVEQYNARLDKIAAEWTAQGLKDFAVVNQPFLKEQVFPSMEWFSELDCFHPSKKAHQALAVNLWNSLFVSPTEKSKVADLNITNVHCPTESSRFKVSDQF